MNGHGVAQRLAVTLLLFVAVAMSAGRWWAISAGLVGLVWAWKARRPRAPVPSQGPRDFPIELRKTMLARDFGRCRYHALFGVELVVHFESDCEHGGCDRDFEADHVVAYSRGGPTTLDNGLTACRKCNRAKGDRLVADFLAHPGFEWERAA